MKRPTAASLKRVTAENLERLGAERLAEILLEVAGTRVELKRRLRMELAAEQGPEHLLPEIDRRIALLGASRGAVSWRQRPAFVRDLDGVRGLIAGRLAGLDLAAAQDRIVVFLGLSANAQRRVRDKEGAVDAVFARAARDAVEVLARAGPQDGGARLASAIARQPHDWSRWSAAALFDDQPDLARSTLGYLGARTGAGWPPIVRRLADAAGDAAAFSATFSDEQLRLPQIAAEVAQRFIRAGDLEQARQVLEAAVKPGLFRRGRGGRAEPDFDWESAWIDYLEAAGRSDEAQAARWASFERTLSAERARAYVKRLPDFEDVEAEERAFAFAQAHPDAERALTLLIDWPALPEAARFIAARAEELRLSPEQAELWARRLRRRFPEAAQRLLRRAAAEAFRRREYKTSTHLTQEADAIGP
jgi:ribosomal protein L22